MARKKHIKTVYDSDGPWVFVTKLLDQHPKLAQYAMKRICYEIIKKAKRNVREGRSEWEPLYHVGDKIGESTIKWNNEKRYEQRDRNIPLYDTGELLDSIKIITAGSTKRRAFATVGSLLDKAAALEYGKENPLPNHEPIPGRPFLTPAVLEVKNSNYIKKKIRQEISVIMKTYAKTGTLKIPTVTMP